MSRLAPLVSITLLCVCAPAPANAQDSAAESPAHISLVDGAAVLERDGRTESAPASMPLLAGDRVRTQNGRVEILYADGSTLHLDTDTLVDFQSNEVIRLLSGRVRLNIINLTGANRRVSYRVDAPSAWVQVATPGEYRISVLGGEREPEVELAVLRGAADLVNEDGRSSLAAGERAFARAGASPSSAYVFNSAAWDAFDRWSEARRDTRLGVSTQYVPDSVQSYASTFNQYGSWQHMPTYGYVWYPRVRVGWRPYYYGRWTTLRPWGWTWIGSDPWGWPTHHFGRWGFNAGAWFWIPGRRWGPAWVSWAYAPGYVSWCPLGWNNQPVIQFVNVNVYRGFRHDPWNAWTVVPHRGFGSGFVNVNVINATRIDVRTRNSFVVRDAAPDFRGYAVPRSTAPIRVAGTRDGAITTGSPAFRGAPRTGTGATSTEVDPTAAFRSRRSTAAPLSGSGYPAPSRPPASAARVAPAREPRASASIPSPGRPGVSRSREPGTPDAAPYIGSAQRRAVPREVVPSAPPSQQSESPSRRAVPEFRSMPAPDTSPFRTGRPDGYRAVPRDERRDDNVYAPPSFGAPRERSPYRPPAADAPDPGPRAVPRSAPDSGGPPAGYRSRPGIERSAPAPSGPPAPPSATPSRPSGPPSGPSSGEAHPRGGGQPTGRAVPRGRGGL